MPKRAPLLLLFVATACGDPPVSALPRTPIPAQLRILGDGPNVAHSVPVVPSYVGYRGEGEAWLDLTPSDTVAFDIRHERYVLWVVCAPREGETREISHVLYLDAEDTVQPTVRCPIDAPLGRFPSLEVEFGETGAQLVGVVVGHAQSPNYYGSGSILTIPFFVPAPTTVDVAMLSIQREQVSLHVERDVSVRDGSRFAFDFEAPFDAVEAATLEHPFDAEIDTVYITGGGTNVHLLRSRSSSVAVVADADRDADDVYVVGAGDDAGFQLSYRVDATTATFLAPRIFEPWSLHLGPDGLRLEGIAVDADQVGTYLLDVLGGASVRLLVTPGYLGSDRSLPLDPPRAIASAVVPTDGDAYQSTSRLHECNGSFEDLLDGEIFQAMDASPRTKAGLDVRVSQAGIQSQLRIDAP